MKTTPTANGVRKLILFSPLKYVYFSNLTGKKWTLIVFSHFAFQVNVPEEYLDTCTRKPDKKTE